MSATVVEAANLPLPPIRSSAAGGPAAGSSAGGPATFPLMAVVSEDPISLWLKLGALEKLEQAVLDGYGDQLFGKTSRIPQVNKFLRQVPAFQAKINEIHKAIVDGRNREVQQLIDHKKLAFCRDHMGASPLHKAVLYNQKDIVMYLLEKYPSVLHARDHQGRTPLHYAAVLPDEGEIYQSLLEGGADERVTDVYGHKPDYYLNTQDELTLEHLKEGAVVNKIKRIKTKGIKRVKQEEEGSLTEPKTNITKSYIKELLSKPVDPEVWDDIILQGHADKFLGETSQDPDATEALESLPVLLEEISEVHRAAVRGRITGAIQNLLRKKFFLAFCRDKLGATPLHKAVLYGHLQFAQYLAEKYPKTVGMKDIDGRTALHYAAMLKDDKEIYYMLLNCGASSGTQDAKGKTPERLIQHPDFAVLEQILKRSQRVNAAHAANTTTRIKARSPLTKSLSESESLKALANGEGSDVISVDDHNSVDQSLVFRSQRNSRKPRFRSRPPLPPPRLQRLEVTSANLRKWAQEEDLEKLEGAVIQGYAQKVLAQKSESEGMRTYMEKDVPQLMERIEAIHTAISNDDLALLEKQLDKEDYALAKDHMGMTPLHRAVILGREQALTFLIGKFPETVNARDNDGRTALHYAAAKTRRDGLNSYKLLLETGADINIKDNRGRTPEYYRTHHLPISTSISNKLKTALHRRSQSEPPLKRKLLSAPPAVQERISLALKNGDILQLQELVFEGYGQHLVGRQSWFESGKAFLKTLSLQLSTIRELHEASAAGDLDKVTLISESNEELLRVRNSDGQVAIHIAVSNDQPQIVKYLVDNFPQTLLMKDTAGRTALHVAGIGNHPEIYKLLIDSKADTRIMDQRGKTADYYLGVHELRASFANKRILGRKSGGSVKKDDLHSAESKKQIEDQPTTNDAESSPAEIEAVSADAEAFPSEAELSPAEAEASPAEAEAFTTEAEAFIAEAEAFIADAETSTAEVEASTAEAEESSAEAEDSPSKAEASSAEAVTVPTEIEPVISLLEKDPPEDAEPSPVEAEVDSFDTDIATDETGLNPVEAEAEEVSAEVEPVEAEAEEVSAEVEPVEAEAEEVSAEVEPVEAEAVPAVAEAESTEVKAEPVEANPEQAMTEAEAAETEAEPTDAEAEPTDAKAETTVAEAEPTDAEAEPTDAEAEPTSADTEVTATEVEPSTAEAELTETEAEPSDAQVEPAEVESEPTKAEEESAEVDVESDEVEPEPDDAEPDMAEADAESSEAEIELIKSQSELDGKLSLVETETVPGVVEAEPEDVLEAKEVNTEVEEANTEAEEVLADMKNIPAETDQAKANDKEAETEESLAETGEAPAEKEVSPALLDGLTVATEEVPTETEETETEEAPPLTENAPALSDEAQAETESDSVEMKDASALSDEGETLQEEPVLSDEVEAMREEAPVQSDEVEAEVEETPALSDEVKTKTEESVQSDEVQVDTEEASAQSDEVAAEMKEAPAEIEEAPPLSDEMADEMEEAPALSDEEKTETQDISAETEEASALSDEVPAEAEEVPADAEEEPPKMEETSAETEEAPTNREEASADTEEALTETNKAQADSEDAQAEAKEALAEMEVVPVVSDEAPANTEEDTPMENVEATTSEAEANSTEVDRPTSLEEPYVDNSENGDSAIEVSESDLIKEDDPTSKDDVSQDSGNVLSSDDTPITDDSKLNQLENDEKLDETEADIEAIENAANTKTNSENSEEQTSSNGKESPEYDRLGELIDKWISEKDLLRLEHVVIAGQGERLIGRESEDKQVAEFLNLVPTYMERIRTVHEAVIRGNISEVRAVLTRKRFALSRDHMGAGPLHLAVLHGHTDVLLYIVHQFPETLDGPDNEGRTPLHYASAVQDGGHYYTILKNAGANSGITDKVGNTPEHYLEHPEELSIRDLLESYRALNEFVRPGQSGSVDLWQRPPTAEIMKRLTPPSDGSETPISPDDESLVEDLKEVELLIMPAMEDNFQEDFAYTDTFSHALVRGLLSLSKYRPDDPIGYLASSLLQYANHTNKSASRSGRRSGSGRAGTPYPDGRGSGKQRGRRQSVDLANGDDRLVAGANSEMGTTSRMMSSLMDEELPEEECDVPLDFEDHTKMKDEEGKTVLHFAAIRSHMPEAFYTSISQTEMLLAERDVNFKTARDLAEESNLTDNVATIDRYVVDALLEQRVSFLQMLLHEGYDHLSKITNADGLPGENLVNFLETHHLQSMVTFLQDCSEFQTTRDELHTLIRHNVSHMVESYITKDASLVTAKNNKGRCALHIAVLFGNLEIIESLVKNNSSSIHVPDNMGRTPLHYSMGTELVDQVGRILIKAGALRSSRDVKMRTPSFYFVYKTEVQEILKEEMDLA